MVDRSAWHATVKTVACLTRVDIHLKRDGKHVYEMLAKACFRHATVLTVACQALPSRFTFQSSTGSYFSPGTGSAISMSSFSKVLFASLTIVSATSYWFL